MPAWLPFYNHHAIVHFHINKTAYLSTAKSLSRIKSSFFDTENFNNQIGEYSQKKKEKLQPSNIDCPL